MRYRLRLFLLCWIGLFFSAAVLSAGGAVRCRIMAANISSGKYQSYDPGEGIRIFQGLQPDVVLMQEFNYRKGSLRKLVSLAFGPSFAYHVEAGEEQIPNGIISRYPILAAGEWEDVEVSNRDFAWAQIDLPGEKDLWAVSVHFLSSRSSKRPAQAAALVDYIKREVPEGHYLVIGGDFNTSSFEESTLQLLAEVVDISGRPRDQDGATGTNASRRKPYDQVLPNAALASLETAVVIPGHDSEYPQGLVFDSRVFTPLGLVCPIRPGGSAVFGMQHMAVVRDFLLP